MSRFRRLPFQKKIGAGLTLEQFEAMKAAEAPPVRRSSRLSCTVTPLCTTVMRFRPWLLAYSKAKRETRVEAFSVMIFRLSTTPGTTSCSSPE